MNQLSVGNSSVCCRVVAAGLELLDEQARDVTSRLLATVRRHVRLDGLACDERGLFAARSGPLTLGDVTLATWSPRGLEPVTRLCPFELRYLAETGFPHPRARTASQELAPLTDLHAHLAGCARPETLVELGLQHDVRLSAAALDELGVRGLSGEHPLRSLAPTALERVTAALRLPADRQSTFRDMERAYRLRGPFTKSLAVFPALLDAVVADYAAAGTRHVELSLGTLTQRAWLEAAVEGSTRAQQRHGLTVRWLTAISRHDDPEWDEDLLSRVEALGGCRELVGVDWMGHETNSTRAFAARLHRLAQWAHRHRPGFVLRVHAGENPSFPENVRVACEAVRGLDVTLRIGHALYGSDEALELLRETRAIVELNLTSNFTLNNIASTAEVPLGQLLAAGVRVVLGTDGPGLYGTSPADELRAARLAGLDDAGRARLAETEAEYLAVDARVTGRCATFAVPDDPPPRAFTPEVASRLAAERAGRRAQLEARCVALGIPVVSEATALPAGSRVVCIAGAWRQAWAEASEASRRRITEVLEALVPALPPDVLLVTGGTSAGVEGEVHRLARAHGRRVLATLVEATAPADLGPGPTAALFLAATPHEKAARLYELMREADALCLFLGGGNVVHDELRAAANLRLRYLALAGVDGASGRHAARVPHRAFQHAADVLRRLDDRAFFREGFAPFWHPGVNPTVDVVVTRAPGEVLLVRRHEDAAAEPGQWALPGGFVHTGAPRGAPFAFDVEAPLETALREVKEEAGLELGALKARLRLVAEVEGAGRDERDTPVAWSRTWLFAVHLDAAHAAQPVVGGDDAADARWFALDALPRRLAFDHARLLALARGAPS